MRKNILILILVTLTNIFSSKVYGQTVKYSGGTIEYTINGRTKPLGKNVTLKFDSFFKSYSITYTDINGYKKSLTFEYEAESGFSYNGALYHCGICEAGLNANFSKNGNGFITFSDLRKSIYGGTGQSFSIKNLSTSK